MMQTSTSPSSPSKRDRIGAFLRENHFAIWVELLLVALLFAPPLSIRSIILWFIGWLSLWLRQSGWRKIGMSLPKNWRRTVLIGTGLGIAYQLFSIGILTPSLHRLTGETLDLSQFAALRDNLPTLFVALIVSWTLAAFGEEMAYRGYLLNRVADLVGHGKTGSVVGLLANAIFFGLSHRYQGITGVIETFAFGVVLGGLYLAGKRNLWLTVIAHGVNDTIGFALIFFGLYP